MSKEMKVPKCCVTCEHSYYENDEAGAMMLCGISLDELYVDEFEDGCQKWTKNELFTHYEERNKRQ